MAIKIFPYKMYSQGARELAHKIDALRVKEGGRYKYRIKDTVVNWGNSHTPTWYTKYLNKWPMNKNRIKVLNNFAAVQQAIDKLFSLGQLFKEKVPVPKFTTDYKEACQWAEAKQFAIVERSVLDGSGGRGIMIAKRGELPRATHEGPWGTRPVKLWVEYINKEKEFRVHVFNDEVIDVQQKRKKEGVPESLIRNLANGYVYCREEIELPEGIELIAKNAVRAVGLDFGAVDIVVNKKRGCFVLEINSAPGLEGASIVKYADAVKKVVGGH